VVGGSDARVSAHRVYPASLGTQVVKVFDLAIACAGRRDIEARSAGYQPRTTTTTATDHTGYYLGAQPIILHTAGDRATGRLLGVQTVGGLTCEIANRIDAAAAVHAGLTADEPSDLDLSHTPPSGTAWDAPQTAARAWRNPIALPADPHLTGSTA
jgi:hypothetical protein